MPLACGEPELVNEAPGIPEFHERTVVWRGSISFEKISKHSWVPIEAVVEN